ncbi:MAG: PDZ domain-containing protein [Pirellulaceae bacterium]|nr:PDZ domain-containing protein [Pirellulaceae bacterium]
MLRRKFLAVSATVLSALALPINFANAGLRSSFKKRLKKITPSWLDKWGSKVAKGFKSSSVGWLLKRTERELVRFRDRVRAEYYRAAKGLYLSRPTIHRFDIGVSGAPVYFVNGAGTTFENAKSEAIALMNRLQRPVYLIFNSTAIERFGSSSNPNGLAADVGVVVDFLAATFDKLYLPPIPSPSKTTRQLAHLFVNSSEKISLVTHSQGCLIAQNAALIAAEFRRGNWMRENVRWVATGSPISNVTRRADAPRLVQKFTDLLNPGDPIILVRGELPSSKEKLSSSQHDFESAYVPRVDNIDLWHNTEEIGAFDTKLLSIANYTPRPLRVRVQFEQLVRTTRKIPRDRGFQEETIETWQWTTLENIDVPRFDEVVVDNGRAPIQGRNFRVSVSSPSGQQVRVNSDKPVTPYRSNSPDYFVVELEDSDSISSQGMDCIATGKFHGREVAFISGKGQPYLYSLDDQHEIQVFEHVGSGPEYNFYKCISGDWTDEDRFVAAGKQLCLPRSLRGAVQVFDPDKQSFSRLFEILSFDIDRAPAGWDVPALVQTDGVPIPDDPNELFNDAGGGSQDEMVLGVLLQFTTGETGGTISQVYPNSPASRAGLRVNDLILSVDAVRLDFNSLDQPILDRAGRNVTLEVMQARSRQRIRVTVQLNPISNSPANPRSFDARLGINGEETRSGVRVASVASGSLAHRIGLNVGDIVMQIDGTNVYRPDQVLDVLARVANHRNGQFAIRVLKQNGQVQELQTYLNQR